MAEREPGTVEVGARSARPNRFRLPAPGWRDRLLHRLDRGWLAIAALLERDLEAGQGFAWLVVVFGLGAATYLALPREPSLIATVVASVGLALGAAYARRAGRRAIVLLLAAAFASGIALGKIAMERAVSPRLDRERTLTVTGWVASSEAGARGSRRLTVEVAGMEARGLPAGAVPKRIVVTARGKGAVQPVGAAVRFVARLKPPDGPAIPGGYDFARRAFHDGRGASGFVLGKVDTASGLGPVPWQLRLAAPLYDLRAQMADRIRAALPGTTGAIAAALIVGEERSIPTEANDALRIAGLYHIISISGLHMSLVAGLALFGLRFGLALWPSVALRYDTRKIAAAAAIVVASIYLGLSGAAVATVRSWIMITLALVAILLDRPALTMRTVAVAAALILAVDPAAIAEPGFLMSFLAVIGLVALYEAWPVPRPDLGGGWAGRLLGGAWNWVVGASASSLVAGLATLPVVIDQFHRYAPYGLLANLVVLPIVGVIIMPFAVVTVLAMPFGLDPWVVVPMGWGIDAMMAAARFIAALPGGSGLVGRIHPAAMPIAILGFLWLALWRTRLRWAGLAPVGLALILAPFVDRPAVTISDDGHTVAARGADGRLVVIGARDNSFAAGIWLTADSDPRRPDTAGLDAGWRCDSLGCAYRLAPQTGPPDAPPTVISLVRDPRAFEEDCGRAAIIVTSLVAPAWCRQHALVFDRDRLRATGTVELGWTSDGSIAMATALPRFARPWTPSRPALQGDDADPFAIALPPDRTGDSAIGRAGDSGGPADDDAPADDTSDDAPN